MVGPSFAAWASRALVAAPRGGANWRRARRASGVSGGSMARPIPHPTSAGSAEPAERPILQRGASRQTKRKPARIRMYIRGVYLYVRLKREIFERRVVGGVRGKERLRAIRRYRTLAVGGGTRSKPVLSTREMGSEVFFLVYYSWFWLIEPTYFGYWFIWNTEDLSESDDKWRWKLYFCFMYEILLLYTNYLFLIIKIYFYAKYFQKLWY